MNSVLYHFFPPPFSNPPPCVLVLSLDFYAQIMGRRQTKYARNQSGSEVKSVFGFCLGVAINLKSGTFSWGASVVFILRFLPFVMGLFCLFSSFVFREKKHKIRSLHGLEKKGSVVLLRQYSLRFVLLFEGAWFLWPIIHRQRKIVC